VKPIHLLFVLLLAPVFAQTKYQNDVIALHPLGFWPLNGNPSDVSGHGNNGTLTNGTVFSNLNTSPVESQSAVFTSAVHQGIVVQNASSFNLGNLHAFTAMAWIKTVSQGNGGVPIIAKIDTTTNTGWAAVFDNSDQTNPASSGHFGLVFLANNQDILDVFSTRPLDDGSWHFVAVTYDGGGKASGVQLYIDGLPLQPQQVNIQSDKISSGSILNPGPLLIGGGTTTDIGGWFDGGISGTAVFDVALTSAQILQLAEDANYANAIMPQFAFGGGWYSAVYFSSVNGVPVSFPVNFKSDHGTALTGVPGGSTQTINLPSFGSTIIEAPNSGDLNQGYVTASLPPGVTGYAIFRQSLSGVPDQEAVAPLSPSGTGTLNMVYDDLNAITALALVNPGGSTSTITIMATGPDGSTIATSAPIVLAANNKTENVLRSFPGLEAVAGTRGKLLIFSSGGPVSALGFRVHGVALTDIPAVPGFQISQFIGTP